MGEAGRKDKCPLCSRIVPVVLLDGHVNSHLDDEEMARDRALAQQIASTSNALCGGRSSSLEGCYEGRGSLAGRAVHCDRGCKQEVPIQEWDSHCLQHKLALEEAADDDEDDDAGIADRGLSKRARGSSYGDGRRPSPSAWQVRKTLRNKPLDDNVRELVGCQVRETAVAVREGLMHLLQRCLEAEQRAGFSTVALSGYVEHYESRHREDLGWGCGWRNIQMLASHLLMEDPEAKDALFGGCGFVPDIAALQRWLELAWTKGFDTPGAEYFNWEITGTHKWIGTTECAALLRSFGMRARIVDFQAFGSGKRVEPCDPRNADTELPARNRYAMKTPSAGSGSSRQLSPVETDEGECTGCGEFPILGTRYRHTELHNSDLCTACMEGLRNSCNKHDREVAEGYVGVDAAKAAATRLHAAAAATVNHQHIVDWVWNYFIERSHRSTSPAATAFDRLRQPMILSKRSPLYFQHRGHSRTIVGIERRRRPGVSEEVFLIILDPSQRTEDIAKALRERSGWQRLLKRGLRTLKQSEYQLCYVEQGAAHGTEYENLKVLSSVHYTY